MLVASAHWDDNRKRFRILRPPADHITSICIDSGGFTAARKWGKYPWTVAQYVDFIRQTSRDVPLDCCAIMDYACEPSVNRSTYATNIERITATIRNEAECKTAAPGLPWLPVLQGDSLKACCERSVAKRAYDLARRQEWDLLPASYAGIGSVCGRSASSVKRVVKFYADHLPGVRFHGFGMHIQALDDDAVYNVIRSWDSYGWTWGRGQKDVDRPPEYRRIPTERYTDYTKRLARLYWQNTVLPRLERPRQMALFNSS